MNKVRTHPAKEASLGTLGGLARLTAPGQGFAAIMEQLGGKNFVAGYQKIKGTGPVGEIEGLKTEQGAGGADNGGRPRKIMTTRYTGSGNHDARRGRARRAQDEAAGDGVSENAG